MSPKPVKYALTPLGFILDAVRTARSSMDDREHPVRIELHPAAFTALICDAGTREILAYCAPHGGLQGLELMGVKIVQTISATQPKLITASNQVKYL